MDHLIGKMMDNNKQAIGKWGEELAVNFLINKGYKIIGRNIRTPYGEIDILATCDQTLVFAEVKTRMNRLFGNPETAINHRKISHMEDSAQYYIQMNGFEGDWQLDAISVLRIGKNPPEIFHFENVSS